MARPEVELADVLSRLERLPARRAYPTFESLVLRVLQGYLERQGKTIAFGGGHIGRARVGEWDAYLPDGIDAIEGPGAVEVKYLGRSANKAFVNRLQEFMTRFFMNASRTEVRFGLLVHNGPMTPKQVESINRYREMFPTEPRIEVWGLPDLQRLVREVPLVVRSVLEDSPLSDVSLFPIHDELRRPETDWQEEAAHALGEVRRLYSNEEISLFLGAGVSISAGVPAWDDLIAQLFIILARKEFGQEVDDLHLSDLAVLSRELEGRAPLLAARYMRSGLTADDDEKTFEEHLTEALYGRVSDSRGDLLSALGRLCQPTMTGARVRSVVTFNFDDLLEKELEDREIRHRAVNAASAEIPREELAVYHVHGFLPRDRTDAENASLAFSEEGYHAIYTNVYHWSNLVQLNTLRERPCLFIGLSMTDPNLRRLLEIVATGEKTRHFAFLKRWTVDEALVTAREHHPPLTVTPNDVSNLLRVHHTLTEQLFKELDIRVVWYRDHTELPDLVRRIYQ